MFMSMNNKAPEKIYLNQDDGLIWHCRSYKDDIEYIRTDAFIEKACEGIEHLLSGYIIRNFHFGDSYEIDTFIEDLKNYIKRE